ncbi:conserved hypothetical protein (plasmid) [Pseudarthrobacter chlorophenolicus A6]|uniref:Helix-turn-helix domain-containing protein n=1 Tax=Pseudarthrobacter chlorophenolicus (strain ATCC 700700 / DSM 12829 / CIP 107037 / JCM 12360 / KCTC 9906 / NCIMB 13794 / A6) TaxID=452863 RepID=B8HID3_PSECP|nr:helix-turn-helix domain-containing protein [Pseudarthrobacter chlorophenolicus]ACL42180.1 conserved hypothetical protein [Pseudarthrobacter chlorophenolicus A6]SDQ14499.1 Helix-turn-helix domain-containing protein [Pseudarthrobacter chlorophenolicus]
MPSNEGLTTKEVANRLGITPVSVRQLTGSGQLTVTGKVGRSILIDPASVERLASSGTRRGRAWAPKTAWAALALLSDIRPTWLSSPELSRLKNRLRKMDAGEVAILARNKDKTRRYRITVDGVPLVIEHLIPTGQTSMSDENVAASFGMSGGSGIAEGYVMAGDAQQLADAFGMVEDPHGNVILHEVEFAEPFERGKAPVAAVAVDLINSLAVRERSAGERVLNELLHG